MGIIRFLLAVSVVFAHAGPLPVLGVMAGGTLSVQCFFILSGFYMTLVLNEKYEDTKKFYWNRFSRIFSAYWIALIISVAVHYFCADDLFARIWSAPTTFGAKLFLSIANIGLFGSDGVLFLDATHSGLKVVALKGQHLPTTGFLALPQAWSLSIELMFYVVAPFVCRSKLRISLLLALSLFSRYVFIHILGDVEPWNFRIFPVTLLYFCIGSLCYYILPMAKTYSGRVGIASVAIASVWILTTDVFPIWNQYILLIFIGLCAPFALSSFTMKFDKELGDISYMIYLIHIPVLFALDYMKIPHPLLVFSITVAIAFPLHRVSDALDSILRSIYKTRKYPEKVEAY